jgi:mannose-6-phosphate isomerase-like protein (cupin superfamily)
MTYQAINFAQKLGLFSEHWSPKIVAELNDYQLKLVKFQGEFVWHEHADTDEAFIVLTGAMRIEFRDGVVALGPGELFVVPRGVAHRPVADAECAALLIEPRGTVNTGDAGGDLTAAEGIWV